MMSGSQRGNHEASLWSANVSTIPIHSRGVKRVRAASDARSRVLREEQHHKQKTKRVRRATTKLRRKLSQERREEHARRIKGALDLFIDEEGGYTSVSIACALLVSLALVCGLAQGIWMHSRASNVQSVADAAALSATQVTKTFTTTAQVVDATILSLGLTGTFVSAAGLITALVPGLGEVGVEVTNVGTKIIDARNDFAKSSTKGLQSIETTLPLLQAESALSLATLNNVGDTVYAGVAIPFPATSKSDYGSADNLDSKGFTDASQEAADLSEQLKDEKQKVDDALLKGWRADNIDNPMSCYSRANTLAHLLEQENPFYGSPESWSFGIALQRARAYYQARLKNERPENNTIEAKVDSESRKVFYEYALEQVKKGTFIDTEEALVVDLPYLPQNTETTKKTHLYSDQRWPTTVEDGKRVIHAYAACPGAKGESRGLCSLAQAASGRAVECSTCHFSVSSIGKVAQASTSINNGYEYYWKIVVDASKEWEKAKNEYKGAEQKLQDCTEADVDVFDRTIQALAVPRPHIFPPGAYGCIAVVRRVGDSATPDALSNAFTTKSSIPGGLAIAGATLAPDNSDQENNVLARFFDWMCDETESGIPAVFKGVMTLWGNFLFSYGQAAENIAQVTDEFLSGIDAVSQTSSGSWFSQKLTSLVAAAGFNPADLRIRKPVLCNTEEILQADGTLSTESLRAILQALPDSPSLDDFMKAFKRVLQNELGEGEFTIATLTIPGTGISIPITIDVSEFFKV